ncbi:hypothetical protein DFQ30_010180 [Apophysomyces sp. BC1015]|nr:hypothetical protein DFQ30_010180 [Apophysomyces sp. BC1015]
MTNNMHVENMLHEKLTEEELQAKWKGDDREPFMITNQWTRLSNGKPGCNTHKAVACKECFDWGDKILTDIVGGKRMRKTARKARKGSKSQAVE